MLAMWIYLPDLDVRWDFKVTNVKRPFGKADCFVDWFREHFDPVDLENPARCLHELFKDARSFFDQVHGIRWLRA